MKQKTDKQGRKVRFIRKGGRVIPIRAKKGGEGRRKRMTHGQKAVAAFGGSTAAGLGNVLMTKRLLATTEHRAGGGGIIDKMRDFVKDRGKGATIADMDRYEKQMRNKIGKTVGKDHDAFAKGILAKYSKFVEAAKPSAIHINKQVHPFIPTAAVLPGDKSIYTGTMYQKEDILHELGHVRSMRRKVSMNKVYSKVFKGVGVDAKFKDLKFGQKAMLAVRPYTDLVAEAEASGEALLAIKRTEGTKAALKASKRLGLAYGTYATRGAAAGLTMAGLYYSGKWAYGKMKSKK